MQNVAEWVDLTGKVAHVTGAAKGIGKGIATALSMAGATVIISDVNEGGAAATANWTGEPLSGTIADRIARLPAGLWGDPIEQGKAVPFLASDMSNFVTGIYLPCDGGWLTL